MDEESRPALDVLLNDLEVMALLMLLTLQEDKGGLSEPERSAKEKLEEIHHVLQTIMRFAG